MQHKYILIAISIYACSILSACQTTVNQQTFPTMTFQYLSPIKLLVSDIKLISEIKLKVEAPNVAHKIPIAPEEAVIRWAKDRLLIAGNKNIAKMVIMQANAREIKLDLDKNLMGIFKNQQSHRFEAIIEARLEILDENYFRQAFVISRAQKSITVAEATSMSDRREIWYNLIELLMTDFNLVMQKNIKEKLQNFLL
jgi:hypothetical protein